jgi:hypothetical protein
LQRQLGREELRGSAAGTNVVSAADIEAASWIGVYQDPKKPEVCKPRVPGVLGFERQLSRAAVAANAAAVAVLELGKETGDVDAGVYEPRLAAVWPAAAVAGFTSAARPTAAAVAAHGQGKGQAALRAGALETLVESGLGSAAQHEQQQQQQQLSRKQRLQLLKSYNKQKQKQHQHQQQHRQHPT